LSETGYSTRKKVGWDFGPLAIDWTINHGRYMLE